MTCVEHVHDVTAQHHETRVVRREPDVAFTILGNRCDPTPGLLVGFFGIANNPSITEPEGMVEQVEVVQNAGKDKLSMEAADEVLSATGSSGPRTASANQTGATIGQLVALRPDSQ